MSTRLCTRGHREQEITTALLGGTADLLNEAKDVSLKVLGLVAGEVGPAEARADGVDNDAGAGEGRDGGAELAGRLDVEELGERIARAQIV